MKMSFEKRQFGKDEKGFPGIEIDGDFYSNLDIIIALAKALIKAGAITKQDIKDELIP